MKIKKPAAYILPDKRPWKDRHRVDIRKREGRQREDFRKRNRDRKGYKRPDAGKRPKTHRGASGSSRKHTVVPFKRRLRSKTKADECKEHDRAKECGLVRINPETALQPNDAPRPQLRLVWQDQEQFKEEEGTGGYKRPDAGKRTETRRSTKQRTTRATHTQRTTRATHTQSIMCGASPTVKQEQFTSKETEEEEEDEEKQHKCNSVFGCGKCFCDQCYPPGDALGRRG